jgi:hypothetical protein
VLTNLTTRETTTWNDRKPECNAVTRYKLTNKQSKPKVLEEIDVGGFVETAAKDR